MKKLFSAIILLCALSLTVAGQSECVPLYGDVNGDGVVSVSDLVMLANALAGNVHLSPVQFAAADCYYDGVLSVMDLLALANYLAGNLEYLPMKPVIG